MTRSHGILSPTRLPITPYAQIIPQYIVHISGLIYTFSYPHFSGLRCSSQPRISFPAIFFIPLSYYAVVYRQNVHFSVISYLVGEVGFEPTHSMRTDLQSAPALQLRRSPLITPYRPTDKTCQIFSFPLEGNMLYRHLHQKVFWTGVFCVLTLTRSSHFWLPRFLVPTSSATVLFSDFSKLYETANKLRVCPLLGEGSFA